MIGLDLVRPLDESWRDAIDEVARARGWPTTREPAKLGACVARVSAAYNDPARARASAREHGAARLGFSFARDVPKGAAALRELVACGALRLGGGAVRVLDVGAGLGATTWGVARALEAAGGRGVVDATWVDADAEALAIAASLLRARGGAAGAGAGPGAVEVRATPLARPVAAMHPEGAFDLVLAGNVLSEIDVDANDDARVRAHADLLSGLLERHVRPDGSLVIVEPALRERTRRLHRVRDVLVTRGARVFAPCLHQAPCPALAREGDWCHEDLPVDLPPWLAPVARAAGLRREGLTFSYLVLRRDDRTLAAALPSRGGGRLRVVSGPMPSKGKLEAYVCGELCDGAGHLVDARVRASRLDRDRTVENAPFGDAARGDILAVEPPLELERARVGRTSVVHVCDTETV
jgi:SAM-dependent methyltransferase